MNTITSFAVSLPERFARHREEATALSASLCALGLTESDHPDLTVVIGGDGALLHAIRESGYRGLFVLLKAGTLGHYADYSLESVTSFLRDVKKMEPTVERHRVLELKTASYRTYAANDIMIGSAVKTVRLKVAVDGAPFIAAPASGILLSTPFGSSGYAHSLGGSLLLGDDGYELNLLAPLHNSAYHSFISSIVIKDDSRLTVSVEAVSHEAACDMVEVGQATSYEISKSDLSFGLVHFKPFDEYARLRRSFGGAKGEKYE